jgi:PAS domain S-box-containing protein
MKKLSFDNLTGDLRSRAEKLLAAKGGELKIIPRTDVIRLAQELRVHQIKLEMQDEELRQAQETIAEARDRYADLYDFAPVGYFTLNRKGTIIEVNLTGAGLLGIERSRLVNQPFSRWVAPEFQEAYGAHFLKVFETGVRLTCEVQIRRHKGQPLSVALESSATPGGAGPERQCRIAVIDISQRQRAEAALQRAQQEFRLVVSNIPAVVFKGYLDGTVEFFDDRVEAMTGYPREEFDTRRRYWTDLIFEADLGVAKGIFITALKGSGSYVREYRIRTKTGAVIWLQERSCIALNPEGKVDYVSGVFFDITARKREEEALRESEEKYRIVADYNHDWEYWVGPDGELIYVSPSCERITGYRAEEFHADPRLMETLIHPDDRRLLAGHFQKAPQETPDTGDIQGRIITKDGQERWLSHYCQPIYRTDGRWLGRRASNRDITRRKAAEAAVLSGLDRLKRALQGTVAALANTVETKDPFTAGHHRRVGQLAGAMARELGWPPDQVEGMEVLSCLHDLGKIAVPAEILSRPGIISPAEFNLIKVHSQVGYDILKDIKFPWPVAQAVLQHHERLDGSGYPGGLKGEEILPEARVLAVADVVEAMASHRPYRPALGIETALQEITNHKGKLYDPEVVDICVKLFTEKGFAFDQFSQPENPAPLPEILALAP